MKREEMARLLDHSVLKPEAPEADVRAGAELVRGWPGGFYCVQPSWVSLAARMLAGTPVGVISVVGFPHGCDRTEVKARAAQVAVAEGAAEIDMVLNLGLVKSGRAAEAGRDVGEVVRAVAGTPVKVILETAALTPEEIALACRLCVEAGAAFVKTSTGFAAGGATVEDVALMRRIVGDDVGVKASGGVRSTDDAMKMIAAGANRIGASASIAIVTGGKSTSKY